MSIFQTPAVTGGVFLRRSEGVWVVRVNGYTETAWTLFGALVLVLWLLLTLKDMEKRHFGKVNGLDFLNLKSVVDARGTLTVMEHPPFELRRVYFLHKIASGANRGGHAHRICRRVYVPVVGCVKANIDGVEVMLDDPSKGLLVEPMQWAELKDFSVGAVILVLASEPYDEAECIRDREQYERLKR